MGSCLVSKRQACPTGLHSRRAYSQFCTGDGNWAPAPGLALACYCMMAQALKPQVLLPPLILSDLG